MVAMGPQSAAVTCQTEPASLRNVRRSRAGELGNLPNRGLRRGALTRVVELDVIPRLLLTRKVPVATMDALTIGHVAELTDLTLAPSESAVSVFIADLQAQGFLAEALYLDLLTPSARRLGEFWVDDVCDFTQVTIGLWRLQNVMRALGPAFLASAGVVTRPVGRALLVPLPGEQHTFGLSMVFDFFRRAGWSAWSGPVASRGELATMVGSEWVDVLGFSLASDERIGEVRAEIQAVRQASRNPGIAIMVGGPPFLADTGLAAAVGADGTAVDGLQAVSEAGALMRRAAERK